MNTVLYSVPTGYIARNLLRTGVIERLLARGVRIVILTPAWNDEAFVQEFSFDDRIIIDRLHPYNLPESPNLFRRAFTSACRRTWQASWTQTHQRLIGLNGAFHTLLRKRPYREIFQKYRPSLVVTATTGNVAKSDLPVLWEARASGVKTLCLVHSWDNITGLFKGMMLARPDWLGTWNELQKREAVEVHFYNADCVKVVGPPQFDLYREPDIFEPRETFLRKVGLDPNKKVITLAEATMHSAENTYILDILLDALQREKFAAPVQLFCRMHPRRPPEFSRKSYEKYLNEPLITFDFPDPHTPSLGWNPTRASMIYLANTLRHTDVLVNVASTVTIEACILDVPVVNLGFSLTQPERFKERILDGAWRHHYRYILERNGVYIAKDPADLIKGINQYLKDPSLHRDERRSVARDLCYGCDGKSAERIASFILSLLEEKPSQTLEGVTLACGPDS